MLGKASMQVPVVEAKASVVRKFLIAGKFGLNLTKNEALDQFAKCFYDKQNHLRPIIEAIGPKEVINWVDKLGTETFTGSSTSVFPKVMKASPLFRT